jgi:4-amino-4-deoxy-L-arabinose transferase-like glycosyltransferase
MQETDLVQDPPEGRSDDGAHDGPHGGPDDGSHGGPEADEVPSEVTDSGDRRPALVVALAAVITLVIRAAFLLTPGGGMDADEAATGIMARRMAQGDDIYVFFLGQNYNSSVEQFPQALLFALGFPTTPFVLRIPQLLMSVAACALIYLVGRRLLPSVWHAVLAAVLFAFGPYFLIWKGARSFGSYDAELLVSLATVLVALRFDERTERRSRLLHAFGVGLGFGLTYYLSPSGYYIVLPAALWFFASARRELTMLASAAAGVVTGLLPVLYWTVSTRHFPTPSPGTMPTTPAERFGNLFDEVGRQFIGVAYLYGVPGWPVTLGRIALWALTLAAVVAIGFRWRGILALLTARQADRQPFDMVLLAVPITVAAYVASKYSWFITEPRYLFAAYPILILGLARLVPNRPSFRLVAAAAVLLFVAGPSLTFLVSRADDVPGERDADLAQVVDVLDDEGSTYVYASYWTAMALEFEADDRLTVGTTAVPERLAEERRAVDRAEDTVWVGSRGVNADDITPMRTALDEANVRYRERTFGDITVFDRFSRDVRPWDVGLSVPFTE